MVTLINIEARITENRFDNNSTNLDFDNNPIDVQIFRIIIHVIYLYEIVFKSFCSINSHYR